MTALDRLRGLEVDSDAVALLEAAGDPFDVEPCEPCEPRLGPAVVAAILAALLAGFATAIIVRHRAAL